MEVSYKKLKIREATGADYTEVILLDEYETDYLPAMYYTYISDENSHCYVAEIEGKVVSLMIYHIINGGQAIAMLAGRTLKGMRKASIAKQLVAQANEEIFRKYPNIKQLVWQTNDIAFAKRRLQGASNLHNVLDQSWLDSTKISLEDTAHMIAKANKVYDLGAIQVQTPSQAYRLFKEADHIFNGEWFTVHWVPYKIHPANFPWCIQRSPVLVCSSREGGRKNALHDGISIGSCLTSQDGTTIYDFEYYGKDVHCAFGHFIRHMVQLHSQKENSPLFIHIGLIKPFDTQLLLKLLDGFNLQLRQVADSWTIVEDLLSTRL